MMRYGVNNFTRNAWLTTAATAVMTITLVIVFTTIVSRGVLAATVNELRSNLNIPVYLKGDTPDSAIKSMRSKLVKNANVSNVTYISKEEARKVVVDGTDNVADLQTLGDLDEDVAFPAILGVSVKNFDDVASLEKLVKDDAEFQQYLSPAIKTTFKGEKLNAINTIAGWSRTAERAGLVASGLFVAISMLIIFNTIRMAIFNRKEEIQMMKLIGADKGFIRGPFVVEAVMYGFIAALIATALGYFGLIALEPKIASYGIAIQGVKKDILMYAPLVLLGMITVGSLIGVISSRLAVRRYLKV
jgi:cell division transport system permease protein